MPRIFTTSAALVIATSAAISSPGLAAAVAQQQPAGAAQCREFTASVLIAGQKQQAVGEACLQADGTWWITRESTVPPEVYLASPLAIYGAPEPYPYYWGPEPWFPPPGRSLFGGGYYGGRGYYRFGFEWHERFGHSHAFGGGFFRGGWH